MSYRKAAFFFMGFTAYFYLLLFTLQPFIIASFTINPALYWFITGYFLLFRCLSLPLCCLPVKVILGLLEFGMH